MKTVIMLLGASLLSLLVVPCFCQFVVLSFMKVKPGQEAEYIALEKTWKKIHEARQNAGNMTNWYLYQKEFSGAADDFNFVTVNVYKSESDYFTEDWNAIYRWLPDMNNLQAWNELDRKTNGIRTMVGNAAFYVLSSTITRVRPHKFLLMDFTKAAPDRSGSYADGEMTIAKPLHQAMLQAGTSEGWALWAKAYGDFTKYDYITVNYFSSMAQRSQRDIDAAFKKAHPGRQFTYVTDFFKERTINETVVWRLVDALPAIGK